MSRAAGFSPTLWTRLRSLPSPVVVVLYEDAQSLDDAVNEVAAMFGVEISSAQVAALDEVFERPNQSLLFPVPLLSQEAAISQLGLMRDRLTERSQPLVLFLLKDGAGLRSLRQSPYLASWLRGRILDPAMDEIDPPEARAAFQRATGMRPEEFLAAWSRGSLPDDLDHNLWHGQARLLVGADEG